MNLTLRVINLTDAPGARPVNQRAMQIKSGGTNGCGSRRSRVRCLQRTLSSGPMWLSLATSASGGVRSPEPSVASVTGVAR